MKQPKVKPPKSDKPKRPYVWVEQREVISALRKAFRRYPPYQECLAAAKSEYFVLSKKGKPMRRVQWTCAHCLNKFRAYARVNKKRVKLIDVDHILPVVDPAVGFVDIIIYAKRLFCAIANLQVLCKDCHKAKCKIETKIRAKTRKDKKSNG